MVDFKKIDIMIDQIERNIIPEGETFNSFAVKFYLETKTLTLSKYLRLKEQSSKLPKIMNTKKAGEVVYESEKNEEVKSFLARKGFKELPMLDYKLVMLLRKVDLLDNWQKVMMFMTGSKTIQEINKSVKKDLLPMEIEQLEKYIKDELKLSDQELNWFLAKMSKVDNDKLLFKSIRKLLK